MQRGPRAPGVPPWAIPFAAAAVTAFAVALGDDVLRAVLRALRRIGLARTGVFIAADAKGARICVCLDFLWGTGAKLL